MFFEEDSVYATEPSLASVVAFDVDLMEFFVATVEGSVEFSVVALEDCLVVSEALVVRSDVGCVECRWLHLVISVDAFDASVVAFVVLSVTFVVKAVVASDTTVDASLAAVDASATGFVV